MADLISVVTEYPMTSTRRLVVSGIALVAAAALLTACSSSGTGSGTKAATETSGGTTSSSVIAGSSTTPSSPASPSSSTVHLGSGGGGTFCDLARAQKADEDKESDEFTVDSPAQLEKFEESAIKSLPSYVALAPKSIQPALKVLVAADEKIFNDLKSKGFDYKKLGTADISSFESPAFTKASTTIDTYLTDVCKLPSSVPSS